MVLFEVTPSVFRFFTSESQNILTICVHHDVIMVKASHWTKYAGRSNSAGSVRTVVYKPEC